MRDIGEVDAQRDKVFQREHNIHHEEYHDDDPLKDTIEACPACHKRIENQKLLVRFGSMNKNQKRDVTIRVRKRTKEKLKSMGVSGNDNDDVIFMLIDFYEKHHKGHD